jgi:hypothetical protein
MAAPAKSAPHPLAAKADELGALKKEFAQLIAPFEFKQKRLDELTKEFREACAAGDAEEWRICGARFDVVLTARARWRIVNVAKLAKLIKVPALLKIVNVTIAAIEAACTPEVVAAVVTQDHTGPRTLKTIEKGM